MIYVRFNTYTPLLEPLICGPYASVRHDRDTNLIAGVMPDGMVCPIGTFNLDQGWQIGGWNYASFEVFAVDRGDGW